MPWESVAQHDNPNVCWQVWKSYYLQVLDRHAPLRCKRVRGNTLPWISLDIKNLMIKPAIKHNSQNHLENYKYLCNKVNLEMRKAKTSFFCSKIEDCVQSKDTRKSWKVINNLLGKKSKIKQYLSN